MSNFKNIEVGDKVAVSGKYGRIYEKTIILVTPATFTVNGGMRFMRHSGRQHSLVSPLSVSHTAYTMTPELAARIEACKIEREEQDRIQSAVNALGKLEVTRDNLAAVEEFLKGMQR